MIKIMITLALILNLYSFDNVNEYVEKQVAEEKHNERLSTKIEDDIIVNNSDDAEKYKSKIKEKEKEKIESKTAENSSILINSYFVPFFTFSDSSLSCPPLNVFAARQHSVISDYINHETSEISCSVYINKNFNKNSQTFEKEKKVFTKVYYNHLHAIEIQEANRDKINSLIDSNALENIEDYARKIELTKKAISYKYSSQTDDYLDLADVLTAVVTFNPEIIDFQETFDSKSLVFQNNYFTTYSSVEVYEKAKERKDLINQISKEINSEYDFFPNLIFEENIQKSIDDEKEDFTKIIDNKLVMLVYFIIKYNYIFNDIFYILLIFVAVYGLYNLLNFSKESLSKADSTKTKLQSIINVNSIFFLASFSVIIATTSSTSVSLEIEDKTNDKTHFVDLSFLQSSVLAGLASEVNYLSDELALAVIDSYVQTRFSDTFVDASTINTIAKQNIRYKNIKNELVAVNTNCIDIYDLTKFSKEKEFFKQHNSENNPFVPEAYLNQSRNEKNISNFSLYNTVGNFGYVKNRSLFEEKKLSINSCFEARNKLNNINRKINFTNKRLDAFNNLEHQNLIFEKKRLMIEKIYDDYYKLGFIATAWLNIIEAYEKISELPSRKFEEWSTLILEPDPKRLSAFVAENFILMITIAEPVQNLVQEMTSILTDSTLSWIPLFGEGLSSAASNTMGYAAAAIFADFIDEFIPALRGLFLFLISNVMFILIFLAMFMTFWLVSFAVLFAFLQNSIEKFSRSLVKALISYVKLIILVFMIFITIFMTDLFSQYSYYSIDILAKDLLSSDSSAFEFLAVSILKSIAKIFAIILEFILAYQLLTKGTSTATNFFEVNTNDISDVLTESIANTIQQKVIK